jgi:hypothetical protein
MITNEYKGVTYVSPETAADVTDEMLEMAEDISESWFGDEERIDWEEFIDRLCSQGYLKDGTKLDFEEYDNAAINKIKKHIREYRR